MYADISEAVKAIRLGLIIQILEVLTQRKFVSTEFHRIPPVALLY